MKYITINITRKDNVARKLAEARELSWLRSEPVLIKMLDNSGRCSKHNKAWLMSTDYWEEIGKLLFSPDVLPYGDFRDLNEPINPDRNFQYDQLKSLIEDLYRHHGGARITGSINISAAANIQYILFPATMSWDVLAEKAELIEQGLWDEIQDSLNTPLESCEDLDADAPLYFINTTVASKKYTLKIPSKAKNKLDSLQKSNLSLRKKLPSILNLLESDPFSPALDPQKFKSIKNGYKIKLTAGDRLIFTIENNIIKILSVGGHYNQYE